MFTSSEVVDAEVEQVVSLVVRDFVGSWYGLLSDDASFPDEVTRVIGGATRELERRMSQVAARILRLTLTRFAGRLG